MPTTPPHGQGEAPPLGRSFHRFWTGSLASNLADGVMLTALPLLAAALTQDPLAVSALTAARYLPWLLFGLFAGALVDRVDRVRAMVGANLLRAAAIVVLAVLTATGHAGVALLCAVMFTVMTCEIVYDLAGRALLPALARGSVDRANGRLVAGREVMEEFVGAPTAGFLFVVAAALPLAVNAGAYVLGAVVLLGLPAAVRRPTTVRRSPGRPGGNGVDGAADGTGGGAAGGTGGASGDTTGAAPRTGAVRSVLRDVGEGLRFIFRDPPLRGLVLFSSAVNLAAGAQLAVFVLLVRTHFGVPEALYGVFLAVAAVGAIGGAVLASRVGARLGRFRGIVGGFLGQAGLCAVFALAPGPVVAALAWALVAAASTLAATLSSGVLQQIVPERLLGRVMGARRMLGVGLIPVGALVGGALGRIDLRLPLLFAAAVFAVATLLALRHLRTTSERADEAERTARREASGAAE
ncbi:MFS transporter [Nocardiopsis sp. Huas11]|uniref:MFS transporter n=1 Tax=Nocardiopsis sp. Huas11 TaxID=2183912 RepID=UPI000EB5B90A|nr:MFS transporter [Nocardiopsis sp. Huas11]